MPVYRRGDRGPAVAQLRAHLDCPPPPSGDDEEFDVALDRAVREFQQRRGLTVDGAVGSDTWRAIEESRFRLGDRLLHHQVSHPFAGDDVLQLQQRLRDMGFDVGRCDGVFGARTEDALREFQRNVGLTGDGACGPSTLRALRLLQRTVRGGRPHALREDELIRRGGPALAGKRIVLDPGHGGLDDNGRPDEGVVVGGLTERAIADDLVLRLERRLAAASVETALTRPLGVEGIWGPDAVVDEARRADVANTSGGDLLVSLHVDACPHEHAQGMSSFFYGTGDEAYSATGERFADLALREVVARTDLIDCGSHPKSWDLLRLTRMPAVRLEIGYLTNESDRIRLASTAFRDVVAEGILVAMQRLFLPPEQDPPTGVFRLADLQAMLQR